MNNYVSGVPTLVYGKVFSNITFNINNGIKYFYPSTIGISQISNTSQQSITLSGVQLENSSYIYTGVNHTINVNSGTYENFNYSLYGYDIFTSVVYSGTFNNIRYDADGITKSNNDNLIRIPSPTTSNSFENTFSGTYDHSLSLLTSYPYQLQLLGNYYIYPNTNYTVYGGENYTSTGYRYVTFNLGTVSQKTQLNIILNSLGIYKNYGNSSLKLYVKLINVTNSIGGSISDTIWFDANSSFNGIVNTDGTGAVISGSGDGVIRTISLFTSTVISGTVIVRFGTDSTDIALNNITIN
jgi:hypothetical protein